MELRSDFQFLLYFQWFFRVNEGGILRSPSVFQCSEETESEFDQSWYFSSFVCSSQTLHCYFKRSESRSNSTVVIIEYSNKCGETRTTLFIHLRFLNKWVKNQIALVKGAWNAGILFHCFWIPILLRHPMNENILSIMKILRSLVVYNPWIMKFIKTTKIHRHLII